jgi:hypothetical protein
MRNVLSPIAKIRLSKHYADVALMEDNLRSSGLDWTSVQLPLLTDKPPTGTYRMAYEQSVRGGFRISRADAAPFHAARAPAARDHQALHRHRILIESECKGASD